MVIVFIEKRSVMLCLDFAAIFFPVHEVHSACSGLFLTVFAEIFLPFVFYPDIYPCSAADSGPRMRVPVHVDECAAQDNREGPIR
jgi:hypothetical protein